MVRSPEVAAIAPRLLEIEDGGAFVNVNTREDLRRAAAALDAYPKVKS